MAYLGKKPADIIATAVDTTTGTFSGDLTVDTNTLYVDSANNNVGIGTSSPSANAKLTLSGGGMEIPTGYGVFNDSGGVNATGINFTAAGTNILTFFTSNAERMRITSAGNIGIGTSSPSQSWTGGTARTVQLQGPSSTITVLRVNEANDTYGDLQLISGASNEVALYNFNNGAMRFGTSGTERMRIDSSGNVGIGKTPTTTLDIKSGSPIIQLEDNDAGGAYSQINATGTEGSILITADAGNVASNTHIDFRVDGTEAMRIDSNGNLLVGKTSTSSNVAGHRLNPRGDIEATRSGGLVAYLNRQSTDGDIAVFAKDGTTVGSIASRAGSVSTIILDPTATGGGISGGGAALYPTDHAGTLSDGALTLGDASYRWNNLYLSGGVYLGGTGSANYLDDYEEGTWTLSTSTPSYTISSSTGRYTKIGRIVIIHFSVSFSAVNSSSNSVVAISGLPITPTSVIGFTGSVRENSNTGAIYVTRLGAGGTTFSMNSMDNVTNGSQRTIRTSENYGGTIIYMT